ncbi:MAG: acetylserotonin O-methyltransferase [Desulfomonile sp.]|nr:acetylserotonin O-methyltransferase [Desulfomonile sp.]
MSETWTRETILELCGAFLKPRIVITAAQLNLFAELDGRSRTVEDLCAEHGWSPRGLRILLDALTAMGLVVKGPDGAYTLEASLSGMLIPDGDASVLPMVLHRGSMWKIWSNLTEIVATGNNPNLKDRDARSDDEIDAFIGAMHVVGRALADTIAASVDLSPFRRMLDVGGGSGTYVMAFLKRAPQLTATIFDLPKVVEIARRRITDAGLINRVTLAAGDYNTDPLPPGHDLVLLSAIIHINSREGNQALFRKVYDCLEPGGAILIRDHLMDPTRTRPVDGAIFAVNMLVATRGGNTYTLEETTADLESAGFHDVRLVREGERMDHLLMGIK